jgi:hypothetical protein
MAELQLPGGVRVQAPDPVAQQIVQALAPLLMGISNQLDLLIRMESGNMTRATVKKRLDEFDAKQKATGNGQALDEVPPE